VKVVRLALSDVRLNQTHSLTIPALNLVWSFAYFALGRSSVPADRKFLMRML